MICDRYRSFFLFLKFYLGKPCKKFNILFSQQDEIWKVVVDPGFPVRVFNFSAKKMTTFLVNMADHPPLPPPFIGRAENAEINVVTMLNLESQIHYP